MREALQMQKASIMNALDDFARVRALSAALKPEAALTPRATLETSAAPSPAVLEPAATIFSLSPELLEMVAGHAMPGQAPLVRTIADCEDNRAEPGVGARVGAGAGTGTGTGGSRSQFRIFVRVRPLSEKETAEGEYAALDAS